jgi:predicted RNA binding protein YcfA (HicA-like mRNA interferase family)
MNETMQRDGFYEARQRARRQAYCRLLQQLGWAKAHNRRPGRMEQRRQQRMVLAG